MSANPARRLGRFILGGFLIEKATNGEHDARASLNTLFGRCVVLEARHRWDAMGVEYLVFCEELDAIDDHVSAPFYEVQFTRHEGLVGHMQAVTFEVKFVRREES